MKPRHLRHTLLAVLAGSLLGCASPDEKAARFLEAALEYDQAGDYAKARIEARNAVRVQPKNAAATFLLAQLYEREQDVGAVLAHLQQTISSDPGHVEARIKLGNYFVVGRRPNEAREQIDTALSLAPDNPAAHLLNARLQLLEGDPAAALAAAGKARDLAPDDAEITGFIALLQARGGDLPAAMATIDAGLRAGQPERAEFLRLARVSILGEAGDAAGVAREIESLVADYPDTPAYRMALAEIRAANGRTDEAVELIRTLIARNPDSAEWRIELAQVLTRANRTEDAEAELMRAVQAQPDATILKLALAGFYESRDRRDDALKAYAEVAASAADDADQLAARNRMAMLNVGRDDGEALRIVEGILKEHPTNPEALLVRGAYRLQANRYQDAVADIRAALARQPQSARALLMLARAYVLGGETSLAEDQYRQLLRVEPANAAGLRELGALLASRGGAEAETLLREAVRLDARDADASRSLVGLLLKEKQFDAAAAEAARLAAAGDASGIAEYQQGVALAAKGRNQDAVAAFRASLQKNPGAQPPLDALVVLLGRMGRLADAEALLRGRLEQAPGNVRDRLLLAEVYAASGRGPAAEEVYRALIKEGGNTSAAWIGLAGLQPAGSDAWLQTLAEGFGRNPGASDLALALGSAYEKRRDYEQAIATYERALDGGNSDLIASNLAALLLDARTDAASHTRALALAKRFDGAEAHPLSRAVLGWAYYRNGDYPAAVRQLEQAAAAVPTQPQIRYYLGMAHLRSGNRVGAREELARALDLAKAPEARFDGLEDARKALASLGATSTGA